MINNLHGRVIWSLVWPTLKFIFGMAIVLGFMLLCLAFPTIIGWIVFVIFLLLGALELYIVYDKKYKEFQKADERLRESINSDWKEFE